MLGTVGAQSPAGGAHQPKVTPGSTQPATTVRPYSEWTPTPPGYNPTQSGTVKPVGGYLQPPPGYTGQSQPAGQPANRPRLTNPVMAGPEGVRQAGGELPPPSMDMPAFRPGVGTPTGSLPPPSVSVEPNGSDPKIPQVPPATGGPTPLPLPPTGPANPPPPLVPVPPAGPPAGTGVPAIPLPPAGTNPVGASPAPIVVPPPAVGDTGLPPGSVPVRPLINTTAALPTRTIQNVTLEAVCPETIVFGQEFRYELIVRNTGTALVAGVRIEDEVPLGAKYVGSDPPAEFNGDRLSWAVGQLDAGGEKRIVVRIKPADEGDISSRATVTYTAAVDARTKVTRPRIAVAVTGAEVCRAGEETVFNIKVSNTGTGPAQRMVLQAQLAEGLVHPQGMKIEAELANLPAGESKMVPLKVAAGKAGLQWCQVSVAVEGSADATAKASVNVVEPLLQVSQAGPGKCLVRAEPVYEITLSNPGTAATDPITMYTVLPDGFEFVQGSDNASYSATNRAVVWKLTGLAPGSSRGVSVKLRAASAADGLLRTIAQAVPEQPAVAPAGAGAARPASRTLEAKTETTIKAEGVSAVRFEVIDLEDPVEAGKEAVYEIRVTNQGTGVCTNVQLVAAMGEATVYAGSSGPTQVKVQGQHLMFEPIPTLAVKGEAVYRVRIKGTAAGEARFRVQLTSDQVRTPVVKEECTRFYKE